MTAASRVSIGDFYVHDRNPMYVQHFGYTGVDSGPTVLLVHGGAHTGAFWMTAPDGRSGWASHLIERGWTVLVVDWPGSGRSPRMDDFLTSGPAPLVAALCELLSRNGPAVVVGHSMGATYCLQVLNEVADSVSGFIAVNPASPGLIDTGVPQAPPDQPIKFADMAQSVLTNAERFPHQSKDAYLRTVSDLSPSVFNPLTRKGGWPELEEADRARSRQVPSIVIAGDSDQLAPEDMSQAVAQYLNCRHVMVGRDWDMHGFGHMIPIERGSEEILFRALDELQVRSM